MADTIITFTIPEADALILADNIDDIWPGRLLQIPVPTKIAWAKYHMSQNLIQQVKAARRTKAISADITIT